MNNLKNESEEHFKNSSYHMLLEKSANFVTFFQETDDKNSILYTVGTVFLRTIGNAWVETEMDPKDDCVGLS